MSRPAPFSLRLTQEERSQLESQAGFMPLGSYIKSVVFTDEAPKYRRREKPPVAEQQLLAEVLARLGQTRHANNLNQIAKGIHQGTLIIDEELETDLKAAIVDLGFGAHPIGAYENKITELEKSKVLMVESLAEKASKPKRYEDFLELSLMFLSSPWKIWESGDANLRRIVLRLGFSSGFSYHRIDGARTPKIALPFKALGMLSGGVNVNGATGEKNFEVSEWTTLEELFDTLEDWSHQLENSDFEAWDAEQAAFEAEAPQP